MLKDFFLIMPEIVLVLTLALVIAGEITYYGEQTRLIAATSLVGLLGAFVQVLISYQYSASQVFGGVLSIDGFSLFFKLLFIVSASFAIISVSHTREIALDRRPEYCSLILAATLAMCLLASAADLILIFVTFLFLNIASYFLAGYGRKSVLSTEAAVKYLAFGAVASALLLYSLAILFASTHSINIYEMHRVLLASALPPYEMLIVFMLAFLAFSFQIGAFPMYLLVPDVLEGAPGPVSAFLSIGPRVAGFAVTIRFLVVVFAQPGASAGNWQVLGAIDWTEIVSVISGLSMIFGALLAFRQKSAKRLVGYLVVVETGFMLMGILVLDEIGIAAVLYNLVIELFALMGIFYLLAVLFEKVNSDRLENLKGTLKRTVPECICLIVFLLNLVGSPPMPGFIGKFALLGVAIRHHRLALASVGVIAMVISTVSVARLAYSLIGDFQSSTEASIPVSFSRKAFLASLVIPMTLAGVFADFVFRWAGQSLSLIFW